jgi:hypothetical protein
MNYPAGIAPVTPYSPLKFNRRFGSARLLLSRWNRALHIFRPWKYRRYVTKRRLDVQTTTGCHISEDGVLRSRPLSMTVHRLRFRPSTSFPDECHPNLCLFIDTHHVAAVHEVISSRLVIADSHCSVPRDARMLGRMWPLKVPHRPRLHANQPTTALDLLWQPNPFAWRVTKRSEYTEFTVAFEVRQAFMKTQIIKGKSMKVCIEYQQNLW